MRRFTINPPVFFGASALVLLFVLIGAVIPDAAADFFGKIQTWVLDQFGWFYLLAVAVFVVVVLLLALTRFGRLKLGPDDSTPDFPFPSWVAMLFAAGMGIGLMFFAVGEPMSHLMAPPEADPGTIAAQREAMEVTFFHWGIHAWAIYAVVGLALAYFGYRYNLPLTVRSGLYPILKERINGPIGHAVDIFAIAGTIFGIGTSLGFGVAQINSGLDYLFGIPVSNGFQVTLIAGITALASISVVTGLDKGVRRLSEANLILAVTLMLFVLFAGPTIDLLQAFVENVGIYLQSIVGRTFEIYAYEPNSWVNGWTLFYWAWWISWSPFVGMFIARISRGRTVRQFVVAVLFIPAGFTFIWMTVFGNTAFWIDSGVADGALAEAVSSDISVALFQFFDYLPMAAITSGIAVILVAVFFITSSDSGSLVVDSIASGGETNTPTLQRLYWTSIEGIVAAVLLLAGGLGALQTATIASALPFTVIMLVLCWGLIKGMRSDFAAKTPAPISSVAHRHAPELTWQSRLAMLLRTPRRGDAVGFITSTVRPAMEEVVREMVEAGREAFIEDDPDTDGLKLVVPAEGVRNFVFGVSISSYRLPAFTAMDSARPKERYEVRTSFSDGSAGYDVMGLTASQLIHDILVQFERYQSIVQQEGAALYSAAPETV